jgi:hypothetical protein
MITLRQTDAECRAAIPPSALIGKSVPKLVGGHNQIDFSHCVEPWRSAQLRLTWKVDQLRGE